jgi:predicted PurR-regulated permease PerM
VPSEPDAPGGNQADGMADGMHDRPDGERSPGRTLGQPPNGLVGPGVVFRLSVAGALGVLVVLFAVAALYAARTFMVQILIAVFVAVSLDPLVRWIISRGMRRPQAVAIMFLMLLAVGAALLWAAVPPLVQQANDLTGDFPAYVDRLRERSPTLAGLEARFSLQPRVDAWVAALPGRIGDQAVDFARQFLGAAVSVLFVVVLTIYVMLDLSRLRRGLVRLFPVRHRPQVIEIITVATDKVGGYMIGNLLISVIAGVAAFIMMTVLRVPFALPLALLVAVTDLIPLIGATIGAAACLTVSAATLDLWPRTVLLALFFVLYQQLEKLCDRATDTARHRGHLFARRAHRRAGRRQRAGPDRCRGGHPGRRNHQGYRFQPAAGPRRGYAR